MTAATLAITGATGFVGQAVLDVLAEAGCKVRALTRRPQTRSSQGLKWIEGNLSDAASLAHLCEGADAVLHIAGLTSTLNHSEFDTANVSGTQAVIDAAEAQGVKRIVLVSSLAAREPELSAYGASKAKAEQLVKASALDWTIIRPPAVYGPRDSEMFGLFRAARTGFAPMPPKGGRASIIHVNDLARLLLTVTDAPEALGKIYEPDDGKLRGYSHEQLANAVARAMDLGVRVVHLPPSVLRFAARLDELFRKDAAQLTRDRAGYLQHPDWVAHEALQPPESLWKPQIGGADGLHMTAEWYAEQGWF